MGRWCSMCCCPLPSSNARSSRKGPVTRSLLPAAKASGAAACPCLGYDVDEHGKLLVNEDEAEQVRMHLCPVRAARFAAPGFARNGSIRLADQMLADAPRGPAWRSAFHQEHLAPTPHQRHLPRQGPLQTRGPPRRTPAHHRRTIPGTRFSTCCATTAGASRTLISSRMPCSRACCFVACAVTP